MSAADVNDAWIAAYEKRAAFLESRLSDPEFRKNLGLTSRFVQYHDETKDVLSSLYLRQY